MKRCIVLVILLLSLCGCVPAIIVAGAAASGAVIYDKRGVKTILEDRHATQTAQNLINGNRALKGKSHISVATFNHITLMVGQAETAKLRLLAYQLVSRVKNIRQIYNEVTIGKPISFDQRLKDTWITTKVKSDMLATRGLHSTQMKVVTEDSVVYLLGMVTRAQGNLATNVARRINGVKKVVKVFQYVEKKR